MSTANLTVYARSGINNIVEGNGYGLAHVGLCQLGPTARALRVHCHGNLWLACELVELILCLHHHVTLKWGTTIGRRDLQGVQLKDVLCLDAISWLGAPKELEVAGQNLLGQTAIDNLVDGSCIAHARISANAQALSCGLQHGEQRVQLLCLLKLCVGSCLDVFLGILSILELELRLLLLCLLDLLLGRGLSRGHIFIGLCGVGNSLLLGITIGDALIELLQIRQDLISIVSLPELQVCGTLQKLTHTLRLTDTRHLYRDTTLGTLHLLDIGLNHAKLVDTRANHIERVVDGSGHLRANDLLHLAVSAGRRDFALQLSSGKHLGKLVARGILVVSVDEKGDEVALCGLQLLASLIHGTGKGDVGLVIGKILHHVGHGDLKDYIHTALKVQTQTNLSLETLLVAVDAEILHRILVILLSNGIGPLGRLTVIIACGNREAQVEEAHERQKNGCRDNDSFVLHCVC